MDDKIAVVIPCYKVTEHILSVLGAIGDDVSLIYVVDDKCPEGSGDFVKKNTTDPRVRVLYHEENKGVGGAVVTGYRAALKDNADVVVKVDGDGQMDPRLVPNFVAPIAAGEADYTKGNRFYSLYAVRRMPWKRLMGNAALSFMTKLSSGYWSIFDPTNGYTAIHRNALKALDLKAVAARYFFESDLLIKLGDLRAVVVDVPMEAVYDDETSNLRIRGVLVEFLKNHLLATIRRVFYSYFLRDFSLASVNLVLGFAMLGFGVVFGAAAWWHSVETGVPSTTGAVMIAVLPIILGVQLILFFLSFDIANEPKRPLQTRVGRIGLFSDRSEE